MSNQPVPLLGRLAVHLKMITMEQLAEALREQGKAGEERNLGAVLRELGFINQAQTEKLLAAQKQVLAQQRAEERVKLGPVAAKARRTTTDAAAARELQDLGDHVALCLVRSQCVKQWR